MEQLDYRRLFESAAGLYVVFDRELRIVAASDAYLRATGRQREELLGRTLFEAFPENPAAEGESAHDLARGMYGRIFAGGPPETLSLKRYDVPLQGGGFEERYWDVVSTPVAGEDGSVQYVLSRLVDVTASEERYRSLFESIDAGFCVIEMIYDAGGRAVDYRFLETNPAFERQTGLKDAPAKTMREHAPAHEAHWFEIYGRVADGGEPVRFVQISKALGRWFELYAFRVGDPAQKRVGVLFNDISERVRADEALRESARRKDEFLATLAHELRNPLAPIRTALAILRLKDLPDPELRSARQIMERQVGHIVRLVDDLLDVSRITFGKIGLRRQVLDLRVVAEEAADAARALAEEAGHRLTVRVGTEALWVDGDAVRLGQVVSNLLVNAVRYTAPGGQILLAAELAGDDALLWVQDNGAGIEAAQLEKIFEAFAQAAPAAGGGIGIGIGLTLSRKLVELHGGTLTAHSEGPGRGSRFVARLPLVSYPASTSAYSGVLSKT